MADDYTGVLLEDINDKLQILAEGMSGLQSNVRELKTNVAEPPEMKANIKIIKAAVTDLSKQSHDYETRFSRVEAMV